MKRKSFLMQSIFLSMILFGMHLCFYHAFLTAGSLYKFLFCLTVGAFWFNLLTMCPFPGLEERARRKLPFSKMRKSPIKNPVALLLLLVTLAAAVIVGIRYSLHFHRDSQVLVNAVKHQYDVYFNFIRTPFHPYNPRYKGACGTWLLLGIELVIEFLMSLSFSRYRGMFLGTLFPAMVIAGGLLLGKSPDIPAMILVVGGILGIQLSGQFFSPGGSKHFRQKGGDTARGRLYYPAFLLLLVIVFGAAVGLTYRTQSAYMNKEEELLKIQHKLENKAVETGTRVVQKVQELLGLEQPGIMTNTAPSYSGDTIMTLTTNKKPHDDIYLKGFVGTKYEKGKWSTAKTKVDVEDYFAQETCYQLLTQDYSLYQASKAADDGDGDVSTLLASGTDLSGKNGMTMTIKYPGSNLSTFAYFPYYAKLDSDSMGLLMLDYDRGFRKGRSVQEYKVTLQRTNSVKRAQMLTMTDVLRQGIIPYYNQSNLGTLMGSADDDVADACTVYQIGKTDPFETVSYQSIDKLPNLLGNYKYVSVSDQTIAKYFQYVMAEDLWLPNSGLGRTKQLANELVNDGTVDLTLTGENTVGNLIDRMQRYFAENTSYSTTLQSVTSGEDYVENFLFTQKKGYCEHYATAGAVLFRAMGVPARYVSGYKVSASDFQKNKDGTYTAKVADSQAHAWTEVYTLNAGWTVADMTPGSDDDQGSSGYTSSAEEPDQGDDEFLENDPQATQKASSQGEDQEDEEEEDEETPTPEITPQATSDVAEPADAGKGTGKDSDGETKETASGTSAGISRKTIIGAGCLLGVFGLILLWYSQGWRRRRKLKKCKTPEARVLEQNRQLEAFLQCCGYGNLSRLTDSEYIELLEEIYPKWLDSGEAKIYYRSIAQARFFQVQGEWVTGWMSARISRIRRKALASRGILRRIYVVLLRGWGI